MGYLRGIKCVIFPAGTVLDSQDQVLVDVEEGAAFDSRVGVEEAFDVEWVEGMALVSDDLPDSAR